MGLPPGGKRAMLPGLGAARPALAVLYQRPDHCLCEVAKPKLLPKATPKVPGTA